MSPENKNLLGFLLLAAGALLAVGLFACWLAGRIPPNFP
jgi:hypothetical protein